MKNESPTIADKNNNGGAYWRKPLDFEEDARTRHTVYLIKDRCKGCKFCIQFCPQNVLELSDEFNTKGYHPPKVKNEEECFGCGLCELICPEFAIFINE